MYTVESLKDLTSRKHNELKSKQRGNDDTTVFFSLFFILFLFFREGGGGGGGGPKSLINPVGFLFFRCFAQMFPRLVMQALYCLPLRRIDMYDWQLGGHYRDTGDV